MQELLKWSQREFKELPWRKNRSLYGTLVSEIMLQQTTVSTVKNHFEKFLATFPDLESLAEATEEELLIAWKGLGYYRRARNLKKIAEILVFEHAGVFPKDLGTLQKIPGIGPYTSNALLGIGMDEPALAIDANLERVIARLFGYKSQKGLKLQKEIYQAFIDKKIFHKVKSYRALNEALMDLGRTYCQARKASCELCPMKQDCTGFSSGKPLALPFDAVEKKTLVEHEIYLLRVFILKKDKILVYKKTDGEWLSGQYEVPTFIMKSTDEKLKQYPMLKIKKVETPLTYKTGITKYKIYNSIALSDEKFLKRNGFNKTLEWRSITADDANLSTATSKGLKKILDKMIR